MQTPNSGTSAIHPVTPGQYMWHFIQLEELWCRHERASLAWDERATPQTAVILYCVLEQSGRLLPSTLRKEMIVKAT